MNFPGQAHAIVTLCNNRWGRWGFTQAGVAQAGICSRVWEAECQQQWAMLGLYSQSWPAQEPCPAAELLPQGWSCSSSSTISSGVTSSHPPAQHSAALAFAKQRRSSSHIPVPPAPSLPDKAFPTPQSTQMLKNHALGGGSSDSWWLSRQLCSLRDRLEASQAPYQGGAPSCLCLAVVRRPVFLWFLVVSVNLWTFSLITFHSSWLP